jgi:hypothetical protein
MNWLKSKTFWGAVIVAIGGVFEAAGKPEWGRMLLALGGALGLIGARAAIAKNGAGE